MGKYIISEEQLKYIFGMDDVSVVIERLKLPPLYYYETDLEGFLESITPAQLNALKQVALKIEKAVEGNFSIVKLVQESEISRSVYDTAFVKAKQFRIAEIKNQGVKGTYIKFLVPYNKLFGEKI